MSTYNNRVRQDTKKEENKILEGGKNCKALCGRGRQHRLFY